MRMRSSPMPASPSGRPAAVTRICGGPGGGTALQRDRRSDLARHVRVAVEGDHTAGRLEVDEHVAALAVDAEADQGGVRDRLAVQRARSPRTAPAPRSRRRPRCATPRPASAEAGASIRLTVSSSTRTAYTGGSGADASRQADIRSRSARSRNAARDGVAAPRSSASTSPSPALAPMRRRRSKARAASAVAASRPVPSRPPGHLLDALLGDGGVAWSRRDRSGARRSGLAERRRGGHPVDADGVLGHDQVPPGLDQPGQLELATVGLHEALVQLVDLPVATAVAEDPLGDVPEVVVVAVLGRRHRVDLVPDEVLLRGDLVGSPPFGAGLGCRLVGRLYDGRGRDLRPGVLGRGRRADAAGPEITSASSSAPTRARASFWTGPPSGTGWASPPRRAAATSTATQTTKNSQASQTTNSSTFSSVVKVSWPVSVSLVGQRGGERVGAGEQPEQHRHPDDQTDAARARTARGCRRSPRGPARSWRWKRPGSGIVSLLMALLLGGRCRVPPRPRRAPGTGRRRGSG